MQNLLASLGLDYFHIAFTCVVLLFGGLICACNYWDKSSREYRENSLTKESLEVQAKKETVRNLVRTKHV